MAAPWAKKAHVEHPDGVELHGWDIRVSKGPILSGDEMDAWENELFTMPEMVFGMTTLKIHHAETGFRLDLKTRDSLEALRGQANTASLPYADKWKDKGGMETAVFGKIHVQEYNYDWTYATHYGGTLTRDSDSAPLEAQACEEPIPLEMLKRPDPILFYDELILFEDELADNGSCKLSVKLRVMPSCFFVLMRCYLRVDHVMVKSIDTRFFHEFGTEKVIREQKILQEDFDTLHKATMDVKDDEGKVGAFADGNLLVQHLPVIETRNEVIPVI